VNRQAFGPTATADDSAPLPALCSLPVTDASTISWRGPDQKDLEHSRADQGQRRHPGVIRPEASGRDTAVLVNPVRIAPGEGDCFQHRVDAELGHQILQVGADSMH
jgi:hypothetical protein